MKKMRMVITVLCLMVMVFGVVPSASALSITPDSGVLNTSRWEGTDPGNPDADNIEVITGYSGDLLELYKQDTPKNSGDPLPPSSGLYANSYTTEFDNIYEPENALITHNYLQPFISGSPIYLLVKDGNNDPIWYIYDLSVSLDGQPPWNGTDDIVLSDFWPSNGSISHVAIYGLMSVPEPTTLLLLGLGLIGIAGVGRKLKK